MIPKCDHCPIKGYCPAMVPMCEAIKDPAKLAQFLALASQFPATEPPAEPDIDTGIGWVPPASPCGGC